MLPDPGGPGPAPRRRSPLALALIPAAALAVVVGAIVALEARDEGGRSADGGALASTTTLGPGPVATDVTPALPLGPAGGGITPDAPGPSAPVVPTPGATSAPGQNPSPNPAAPAPAAAPAGLRLGGNDLGVTRVGAPAREAVAAVSRALGRPVADPAVDSACVGAEEEVSWEGFRLGSTGGKVSGWRSTSRALSTPAGITMGSTVTALRQAYGSALQIPPPAEPGDPPVFVVSGASLGGTLSGPNPADTVTLLFNGTCEPV